MFYLPERFLRVPIRVSTEEQIKEPFKPFRSKMKPFFFSPKIFSCHQVWFLIWHLQLPELLPDFSGPRWQTSGWSQRSRRWIRTNDTRQESQIAAEVVQAFEDCPLQGDSHGQLGLRSWYWGKIRYLVSVILDQVINLLQSFLNLI